MYPKFIWRHRILTTIFNATVDHIFGQIHAPATLPNPGYLYLLNGSGRLINLVSFLLAMQQLSQFVLTDKHFLERSLIHSAKRCHGTSSEGEFCGRIFLLCTPLDCPISLTVMWHRFLFYCVYKRMLRWFPSFPVATICLSCSPPDLNFLFAFISKLCKSKIITATGWQHNCS